MNEFKRLLKYLRPHRLTFVLAIVAMIFGALFQGAIAAMLVPLFDQFQPSAAKNSETLFALQKLIPKDNWYQAWLMISVLLVSFTVLKGVAEYFSSYLMAKIGQAAVLDLRHK
jgi:ABC-type multidrug transport system fused ATPase/permease subunit